jgi:hypothetical protein
MYPQKQNPTPKHAEQAKPEGAKRASYQQQLHEACTKWWRDYEESTQPDALIKFDWPAILYDFVKAIALESFKNGVTVGKRKAHANGREQGDPRREPDGEA